MSMEIAWLWNDGCVYLGNKSKLKVMEGLKKQLFKAVKSIRETDLNNCTIEKLEYLEGFGDEGYRVYCGDLGAFEITYTEQEEVYDINLDDWVWIDKPSYNYIDFHDSYDGYPELKIEDALGFIQSLK